MKLSTARNVSLMLNLERLVLWKLTTEWCMSETEVNMGGGTWGEVVSGCNVTVGYED